MIKKLEKILLILVLMGQMLFQGVYLPFFSALPVYLILLMILGVLAVIDWVNESNGEIPLSHNNIGLMFISLTIVITISFLVNAILDIKALGLILFSFLFGLAVYNVIKNQKDIRSFMITYIIITLISVFVEIGQVLNIDFCYSLWLNLHTDEKIINAAASERYLGLASDILQFGYHITAAFACTLCVRFKKRNIIKKFLIITLLVFALITNNTRSSQIAFIVLSIFWIFSKRKKGENRFTVILKILSVVILVVVGILFIGGYISLEGTRLGDIPTDMSALSRIPMFLTALNHGLHHPFGVGQYITVVYPELIIGTNSSTYSYVLANGAHNCIGNCIACFGFLGLILFITIYIKAFKSYFKFGKITNSSYLIFGCVLASIGLLINSFFHNAYLLNGELSSMLFIVLCASSYKIYKNETIINEIRQLAS